MHQARICEVVFFVGTFFSVPLHIGRIPGKNTPFLRIPLVFDGLETRGYSYTQIAR